MHSKQVSPNNRKFTSPLACKLKWQLWTPPTHQKFCFKSTSLNELFGVFFLALDRLQRDMEAPCSCGTESEKSVCCARVGGLASLDPAAIEHVLRYWTLGDCKASGDCLKKEK
jgi:hypothetical protein